MSTPIARNVVRLKKQPSIRDTVKSALRSAIISGELQPGTVHSGPSLAGQFGVSATPIREAMLDLAREGLVVAMPNRGFQITDVSEQDLAEVTQLRLMIEPPAVEIITPKLPDDAFPALREQCDRIVRFAEQGDLVSYLTEDNDFHLALLSYTGNRRLADLVSSLRSQTRLFGLAALHRQGRLAASAREHHAILDAIEARDAARARDLVTGHIEHVLTDWSASDAAETA
ncbi:GntR family transcriptional regulator [Microbacterium indicum]|uniref:GntR family transcriptional regulator n=1 Tax=Microbacterium indicum TaxID=358100 RepID=UPI00041C130B|nr:GntR family transcriptional regulator [Microbacterium indicum]